MIKIVKSGMHYTFGWVRHPDGDEPGSYCYEKPDGTLVHTKRRDHRMFAYVHLCKDEFSGESFFLMDSEPTSKWAKIEYEKMRKRHESQ